jgi:hypothetical protein
LSFVLWERKDFHPVVPIRSHGIIAIHRDEGKTSSSQKAAR